MKLSIITSGDYILPTLASHLLKVEKLLLVESRDSWRVSNIALRPPPVIGEFLDPSDKF